jgi:NADH:ubiquinone oxidoreductase subunit 4 (subunit M)
MFGGSLNSRQGLRVYALWSACLQFFLSVLLAAAAHVHSMNFSSSVIFTLFKAPIVGGDFAVFGDFLTIWLLVLTAFLTFVSVLISWVSVTQRLSLFYAVLFLIQFSLFVTFSVTNLLLFYAFFELLVFPMFILIAVWGSRSRRIGAAFYLFFYTLGSSVLMLSSLALVYSLCGSLDYYQLYNLTLNHPSSFGSFVFWSMLLSFAAKLPVLPFHLWLPEAHVEAPLSEVLFWRVFF